MRQIGIDILNLGALEAALRRAPEMYRRAAVRAVADTVLFAEVEIADQIDNFEAVDTGRLKGSVSARRAKEPGDSATEILPGGLSAVVGTNVSYAIPVHNGYTRKIKGQSVRAAYGARRGRFTDRRVRSAEKASKRQRNLRISGASYSRSEQEGISMHVQGRPFVEAAVPAIEQRFVHNVETLLGGVL